MMTITSYTGNDDCQPDNVREMMIKSYASYMDDHYHVYVRIVHTLILYDAANFVTDERTDKAILGVGSKRI